MTSLAHSPTLPRTAPANRTAASATARRWAGRVLTGIPMLFLLFDGIIKLLRVKPVLDGMPLLGWPVSLAIPLGILLLSCLALYAIPQTAVLGAILLTGYLGGAVATHVRVADPLFSHVLFPVYVGAMLWGGLYLRDARLRALIPFRGTDA